jgi:GT2 family glycosyltransferase
VEGDVLLLTTIAGEERPGLVLSGIGDGRHGFDIALGDELLPEGRHVLHLRCAETGAPVPGSPVTIEGPSRAASADAETDGVAAPARRKAARNGAAEPAGETVSVPGIRPALGSDPLGELARRDEALPAKFRAHLDEVSDVEISGWIMQRDEPSHRCVVALKEGERVLVRTIASRFRPDLAAAGVGDGCHAFSLAMPRSLLDGEDHLLEVVEQGTSTSLTGEPIRWRFAGRGVAASPRTSDLSKNLPQSEAIEGHVDLSSYDIASDAPPPLKTEDGFIDFYGYHSVAGGWLFCGWAPQSCGPEHLSERMTAHFERGEVSGKAMCAGYPRDDLKDRGDGAVIFIEGSGRPLGGLSSILVETDDLRRGLCPSAAIQHLREQELIDRLRTILAGSDPSAQRDALLAILARKPYSGTDTIANLSDRVFLEIDEAIFCQPDGLLLLGWFLAKPGAVRQIRLRCGTLMTQLDFKNSLWLDRPDVLSTVGVEYGFDESRCGFIAFLPHSVNAGHRPYIEVETNRHEVGFRTVPAPKLDGMTAIKRVLESFDVRFLDVPTAYDGVIGPALQLLNRNRLKTRPSVSALDFGTVPTNPRFSVIVPLYGRIDFVEYQFAIFAAHPPSRDVEFIYVLDDPPKRREAQFLFDSIYKRFRIPFRAVMLDRNVGFAPANNIGLTFAHGKFVCFLNSDVFPGTPDWLERLADGLAAHADIGAIGPLLLYEDGSVQHQGMSFKQLNEFGGWFFAHHPGKGLHPLRTSGLHRCISITGACMLMDRSLAEEIGGFDEAYVIGDFEDTDLCLKLHQRHLGCAVDLGTHLFHLERVSQARPGVSGRMNLTLYNAWLHQRRWAAVIANPSTVSVTANVPLAVSPS